MNTNMKKLTVALIMAGSFMAASQVHAAPTTSTYGGTGTVHFRGGVTDGACGIKAESINQNIDLPIVKMSLLSAPGSVAGLTPFKISLTDCDPATFATANATFTGISRTDVPAGTYAPAVSVDSAKGVGLQITDWNNGVMAPGTPSSSWTVVNGNGEMDFTAGYKAGATVAPGSFDATVNFKITYQ